ncbi:MAG: hypothetical protein D6722_28070 [Bacteroidetes bacterium]|nr:MAG: hypothetical protein D6722_28070 [Bacteroidota bacterium]
MAKWQANSTGMLWPEKLGVLAEYDGAHYRVIERKQFTDVTTRHGIHAVPDDDSPLWAIGWDKRALRLKVMDQGKWSTFLLPKATYNNDPGHGWFTEWPRIREVQDGRFLMDMHGMFFDFPGDFSATQTAGIRPLGSHLRYIPDFLHWNGKLVLATDEVSIQGNPLAGQPQSNLWMGEWEDLQHWGPRSAYGSIWLEDAEATEAPSLPFLFAGFDQRVLHLRNHGTQATQVHLEVDRRGDGQWEPLRTVDLPADGYEYVLFDAAETAEWIRLRSAQDVRLTATFHLTESDPDRAEADLFAGLAPAEAPGAVPHTKLYPNHDNWNLTVFAGQIAAGRFQAKTAFELDKFALTYQEGLRGSSALRAMGTEPLPWARYEMPQLIYGEDEASVYLDTEAGRLRLPKGQGSYPADALRRVRELQSERALANIHDTFYELPLEIVGEEPRYDMMRPVATHNRLISDFATWNGLLLLSGVQAEAPDSPHLLRDPSGKVALWAGAIDDLWKLGKPRGEGGVWKDTSVRAGQRSDRYLMTGYDRKAVEMRADQDVQLTLWFIPPITPPIRSLTAPLP